MSRKSRIVSLLAALALASAGFVIVTLPKRPRMRLLLESESVPRSAKAVEAEPSIRNEDARHEVAAFDPKTAADSRSPGALPEVWLHARARGVFESDKLFVIVNGRKQVMTPLHEEAWIDVSKMLTREDHELEVEYLTDLPLSRETVELPRDWTERHPRVVVELDVDLTSVPLLTGFVLGPAGDPLSGTDMALFRNQGHQALRTCRSDSDGSFRLRLPEDRSGLQLVACRLDMRPSTRHLLHPAELLEPQSVVLGPGHSIRGHAPLLEEGTSIYAMAQGSPRVNLARATLVWHNGALEHSVRGTRVRADGSFELSHLGSLAYSLEAVPPRRSCTLVDESSGPRFTAPLDGAVYDRPILGIELYVHIEGSPVHDVSIEVTSLDRKRICSPSNDGELLLILEPLTDYGIRITKDGYRTVEMPFSSGLGGIVRREVALERL